MDLSQLSKPWSGVTGDDDGLVAELRREMSPGHCLYGEPDIAAVARRDDCDDVLYRVGNRFALVHLTWRGRERDPAWPHTVFFDSWSEFLVRAAAPDAPG